MYYKASMIYDDYTPGELCDRKISFCEDVDPCHNGAQCIGQDLDFK